MLAIGFRLSAVEEVRVEGGVRCGSCTKELYGKMSFRPVFLFLFFIPTSLSLLREHYYGMLRDIRRQEGHLVFPVCSLEQNIHIYILQSRRLKKQHVFG